MTVVTMFDGSSCCGPVQRADDRGSAADFAGSAAWLTQRGVQVERHTLSVSPLAFARTPIVADVISRGGVGMLPVVLVDGQIKALSRYPSRQELADWRAIDTEQQVGA